MSTDKTESATAAQPQPPGDDSTPSGDTSANGRRGKPASPDPGAELEIRVGRLEFALGALVRLRVPVRAEGAEPGRNILTDIDVLSVDIDGRLRVARSCLECKSGGKGQSGEPDRLLWLAGLRQLLGFERAVLVRRTVSRRGRALASKLDIEATDTKVFEEESPPLRNFPTAFAHIGGAECAAAESRTDVQLRGLKEIDPDVVSFVRSEALMATPSACLSAIEFLGRSFTRQGVVPSPAAEMLASHALIALIYAAIQDASRLSISSADVIKRQLELDLSGTLEVDSILQQADEIVRFTTERLHKAYTSTGQARIDVDVPKLRTAAGATPSYLPEYLDLVDRFHKDPAVARSLLQTAELVCFDALPGGRAWLSPAFRHLFSAEHRGLLLAAHRTLNSVAGADVANRLWQLREIPFHGPRRSADPSDE